MRVHRTLILSAALAALALHAAGCSDKVTCTAQITEGGYRGSAVGKEGQSRLDQDAKMEACRQKCAAEKTAIIDACATRCVRDIDAGKLDASVRCDD